MLRTLIPALLILSLSAEAQTKKTKTKAAEEVEAVDPVNADSLEMEEIVELPIHDFKIYTKRVEKPAHKIKLCLNLVSGDSILNYCINDSLLRDPEVTKMLFKQTEGDTTYFLVYACAYSKVENKPECDVGKEAKLFFVRWNVNTGKAIVKQKTVESCMRAITNMTIDPIENWAGESVLKVNYHKGGTKFSELMFDPNDYLKGIQTVSE